MTGTIFALSSGHGKSGVAVIRVSGADLSSLFERIRFSSRNGGVSKSGSNKTSPRHAYLIDLADGSGKLIDQCIVIYFQAPASFTGEDVIEIHSHGAPAVIQKIFEYLRKAGCRIAEPGEFSRRAFCNGKMDLAQVDGLAALLDARTDKQRESALKSMTGRDSKIYESWRAQMIEISAYAAAILDYDENDLPKNIGAALRARARKLQGEISDALSGYAAARAVRVGFDIVLTGKTNVGKSSLFNAIAGESRAIVSDVPGTTRDVVSADLDMDGYLARLSDTAGLRESDDAVEKIGIEKTRRTVESADLIIRVQSAERNAQSAECNAQLKENEIIVINKSDLLDDNSTLGSGHCILVSALTGRGIPELIESIKAKIHQMTDGAESDLAVTERARELLIDAADELNRAITDNSNYDIFAEHVRRAGDNVGKILGVIETSEIMDAVFSRLCLGK
jgi:tRNA modification GTPase